MGRNKRLTALLAFTLLTSCTVGPDYQRPKFFNDAEVAKNLKLEQANASPVYHDWYKQFNDLALDGLIEQAWASSPNVKIAVHKLRQARYALRSSNMQSFPMFDIDTGYNYEKTGKDTGFSIKRDYYQLGMDASWELDIWGGNRRAKEASAAVFKAAGANLDNVRLVMAGEVANNYINLRTNQEQLRVAKQNLKLQQDIYELVKQKYEAGLTDFIALNQSQYAVESTKTLIPQLETNIEAYKNAIAVLLGVLPDDLQHTLNNASDNMIRRRVSYNLEQLYKLRVDIIRKRPDVRLSEQNLIAQNAAVGQAVANLYPNVSLTGFIGWQGGNVSGLINGGNAAYSYSPALKLPFFHWNQLMNAVDEQKEVKEQYVLAYQNSILNAVSELRNSVVALQQEKQRNQAYRKSVNNMKNVLKYTLSKYKNGLIDFNDLLIAEQELLKAQTELLASNGAIYQSVVAFYKAAGGGFNSRYAVCTDCENT